MVRLFGWRKRDESTMARQASAEFPAPLSGNGAADPHLEARNLVKGFGQGETRSLAVQGVSLPLHRGELALLMGPSGSGKSTLLALISGLLRPDSGKVVALNEDLWDRSQVDLEHFRLRYCSYIFQGCNLFPALTARQQLELVLRWGEGVSSSEARSRAREMLRQLGLEKKGHLRPAQLSGGEKQRVAIARALVKQPRLLFADEPTSALDWENGQCVIELLYKAAHDRGAMVLVVSHDPRLKAYADRVYHMEDGRLISGELSPQGSHDEPRLLPLSASSRRLSLRELHEASA